MNDQSVVMGRLFRLFRGWDINTAYGGCFLSKNIGYGLIFQFYFSIEELLWGEIENVDFLISQGARIVIRNSETIDHASRSPKKVLGRMYGRASDRIFQARRYAQASRKLDHDFETECTARGWHIFRKKRFMTQWTSASYSKAYLSMSLEVLENLDIKASIYSDGILVAEIKTSSGVGTIFDMAEVYIK